MAPFTKNNQTMVTITNYTARTNAQGENFFALILQGGITMVQSKESGNYYATAKTTTITSTFDEATCLGLVGQKMPGEIVKAECEPYPYVIPETGEQITITHRWVYQPDGAPQMEEAVFEHKTANAF